MRKRTSASSRVDSPLFIGLHRSQIFLEYQQAFQKATGLPLSLHPTGNPVHLGSLDNAPNAFCSLMTRTSHSCVACLALQKKLEDEAQIQPRTFRCFAGLCETALPVRIGENLVAFLHTGHVFVNTPDRKRFSRVAQTLLSWGTQVDVKQLEGKYFNVRVISLSQYTAIIELLKVFAQHLAGCGEKLALEQKSPEPESVMKAKAFILSHHADELSLDQVAHVVNISANYFSELFKKTTGLNFTDYVARVRVEKAKQLLVNPNLRVTEIAFETGFQSVSQFNRAFKRVAGLAPTRFRLSEPKP